MRRFDPHVAAWGALVVGGSLLFPDRSILLGATAGAALSTANWLVFRWVAAGLSRSGRERFLLFLVIKVAAMLGAVALILHGGMVHPPAFAAGVSAPVAGFISGTLAGALSGRDATLGDQGS